MRLARVATLSTLSAIVLAPMEDPSCWIAAATSIQYHERQNDAGARNVNEAKKLAEILAKRM